MEAPTGDEGLDAVGPPIGACHGGPPSWEDRQRDCGGPLLRSAPSTGAHLTQMLWACAHGLAIVGIEGRFMDDSNLDRTWRPAARAFTTGADDEHA